MLRSLSIRNVVLIDKLDLAFESGLCVLTGETGSGKSILLDALGLAIGGVPAVLIAAYVVKSLPLVWVRWLVVIVVVYAGTSLFRAASRRA